MARTKIVKKDGSPTPFFWTDKDGNDRTHKTVFKETTKGVKRKKGVHFDVDQNRIHKD
jgi:hypothetical protein